MIKGILVFIFSVIICFCAHAQTHVAGDTLISQKKNGDLRVSLLTCGGGDQAWESFGHSAIRIIDDSKDSINKDLTYNYGIFDEVNGSLEDQFLRGSVRVFLKVASFNQFMHIYATEGQSVDEIELHMDEQYKKKLQRYLDSNGLVENRYYTYHVFYDNCTTRVRDALEDALGDAFKYGPVLSASMDLSFHKTYTAYLSKQNGVRLFGDVFFGSNADRKINDHEAMFLPEFLEKGVQGATLNGNGISSKKVSLLPDHTTVHSTVNIPFVISLVLAILTIVAIIISGRNILQTIIMIIMMIISGAIGIGILYGWFGTNYDFCKNNFNILWALPTNIIFPALSFKAKKIYSIIAIVFILFALIIHISGIQTLPLLELIPFWLALLFIYGSVIRARGIKAL